MRVARALLVALAVAASTGCASRVEPGLPGSVVPAEGGATDITGVAPSGPAILAEGRASWYGLGFHGRKTANGERFDMNDFTAAHPSLPFGTRVLVRNPHNGRSVVVRINDRGPYSGGRIIDLSFAAARSLGILTFGTRNVVLMEAPAGAPLGPMGRR
ncbi:MAG: septal ring lytic transglycosylase RlpA family protein [Ramlibacter sp.]